MRPPATNKRRSQPPPGRRCNGAPALPRVALSATPASLKTRPRRVAQRLLKPPPPPPPLQLRRARHASGVVAGRPPPHTITRRSAPFRRHRRAAGAASQRTWPAVSCTALPPSSMPVRISGPCKAREGARGEGARAWRAGCASAPPRMRQRRCPPPCRGAARPQRTLVSSITAHIILVFSIALRRLLSVSCGSNSQKSV